MSDKNKYPRVRDHFFFLMENDFFSYIDKELSTINNDFEELIKSFKHSLNSVIQSLSIPYIISWSRTNHHVFDKILTQELIKNAPLVTDELMGKEIDEKERRKNSIESAKKKFNARSGSDKGKDDFQHMTLKFLNDCLENNNELKIASKELLRQGIVLLWSVFEVLSRDFIKIFVNNNPEFFDKFGKKEIPTILLKEFSYDLSDHLGDVLIENVDWSNLNRIKEIYFKLFSENKDLKKSLKSGLLWKICQRRHLIVHRRGLIDQQYIEKTDDNFEVGEMLPIESSELIDYLLEVRNTGIEIIKCAKYQQNAT